MKYEPYLPTDSLKVLTAVRDAGKRNAERDKIDEDASMLPPWKCNPDIQMRTVICALCAGIESDDWGCIAEGLAMLIQAELPVRQLCDELDIEMKY